MSEAHHAGAADATVESKSWHADAGWNSWRADVAWKSWHSEAGWKSWHADGWSVDDRQLDADQKEQHKDTDAWPAWKGLK